MIKSLTRLLALFLALQPALAAAQSAPASLPYHSVYGRIGALPGDTGPGQAIPFLSLKQAMGITTDTVATLKAMVVPTSKTCVYLLGYSSPGDGGEGEICYNTSSSAADDGGTTFTPISNPATGRWQRQRQSTNGSVISARWFGAGCGKAIAVNNAAAANAVSVAAATNSAIYFPGCSAGAFYFVNLSLINTSVSIFGDGLGSRLVGALNTTTVDISSTVGCGGVHDFTIRGVYIGASGSGIGLHIKDAGWLSLENMRVDGPTAIKIECASQFNITNVQGYSGAGPALWITSGGSNSAPGVVSGGQFSASGSSTPAIVVVEPLAIEFVGVNYSINGGTASASISVDGITGGDRGSVTFQEMHSESNYNLASTAKDYEIGCNAKAGSVKIEGGNSWGLGDGAHSQTDFVRLCDARNVEVANVVASKLAGVGFTRSMIRVENTFTGTYTFCGNVADINGTMYSDANGKLTGQTGCASNINQSFVSAFSLSGTLTPAALSGDVNDYSPAGQSSATVLRIDGGAASRNITGVAGGLDGRLLTIINVGTTNPLIFKNQSASSSAANRLLVGLDITIDPDKSLTLRYDGASLRWRPWDSIYSSTSVPISRTLTMTSPLLCDGAASCDLSVNRVISIGQIATAGIANNAVTLAKLATQSANTVLTNATSGAAVPTAFAMPSCSTNTGLALQWLSNTGFQCATISATDISTGTLPAGRMPALTGDVTSSAGAVATTLSAGNAGNLNSGTLLAARLPALTGDVTSSAGSAATTLANIPTGAPAVGTILHTNIAAPSSPAAGKVSVYSDSTDLRFHDKNAAGTIGTTVVADTGAANNYISAISAAGAITKSQPACATLSNASVYCPATQGQLPGIASNTAATAGNIGETIDGSVALGSAVNIPVSGTPVNVTSISLTAGNWEVTSTCYFLPAASTTAVFLQCGPNTTTATMDVTVGNFGETITNGQTLGGNVASVSPGQSKSYLLNATTTVFLVAASSFATSTMTIAGKIHAVRTR